MKWNILPLLLLPCVLTFAQDSSFKLKDYRYRTPRFQSLAINLNFSGSANSRNEGNTKNSSKSFNLDPSQILYSKLLSTDKRLHQTDLYFTPSVYYANYKRDNQDITNKIAGTSFGWERTDRYYKSNLLFFEVGNNLTASIGNTIVKDTLHNEKYNNLRLQNTASVGFGRGRIERVQDAQMALFILNDLAAQGLLNAPVTRNKAYAFAELITNLNNRRVFDFRRKRIFELTQIDSFLRSSGLVTTTDIRHFTTVNDNWSYGINPGRLSGAAWYIRVKPGATYSYANTESRFVSARDSTSSDGLIISLEPEAGYERYVAKSLKWQYNMGASVSYGARRNRIQINSSSNGSTSVYNFTMNDKAWTAKAFYGIGFFPNNRTQLSGNFLVLANRIREGASTYFQLQPSIFISTTYFLGYRTYLSGNLYLNYTYSQYKTGSFFHPLVKEFQKSIFLNFSHILF